MEGHVLDRHDGIEFTPRLGIADDGHEYAGRFVAEALQGDTAACREQVGILAKARDQAPWTPFGAEGFGGLSAGPEHPFPAAIDERRRRSTTPSSMRASWASIPGPSSPAATAPARRLPSPRPGQHRSLPGRCLSIRSPISRGSATPRATAGSATARWSLARRHALVRAALCARDVEPPGLALFPAARRRGCSPAPRLCRHRRVRRAAQ